MTVLPSSGFRRRQVLASLAALPLLRATDAVAQTVPAVTETPLLLVAGPEGGRIEHWAKLLGPALGQALPPTNKPLRLDQSGGPDGVTAANQFDTRVAPDGGTALLLPGSAMTAWLVGDPRAQFDIGHFVPMLAGLTPAWLAGRPEFTNLPEGKTIRIGASGPAGPELTAFLAMELLNVPVKPVFGLNDSAAIRHAYATGAIDAVLLHGENTSAQLAALPGAIKLLAFDGDQGGNVGSATATSALPTSGAAPDTSPSGTPPSGAAASANGGNLLPMTLPNVARLSAARNTESSPLFAAWRAANAATVLNWVLVLPGLTPAARMALWRLAAQNVMSDQTVHAESQATELHLLAGADAASAVSVVVADARTQLALRQFLAARFNWHPV